MTTQVSTGKNIVVLAVVIGCFAVLWPRVFYPMLTSSLSGMSGKPGQQWTLEINSKRFKQLCFLLEGQLERPTRRWSEEDCIEYVRKYCGVSVTEEVMENYCLSEDKTNLTHCLLQKFGIYLQKLLNTIPPPSRSKPYLAHSTPHPHVRQERPSVLHSETMHPALREKGRSVPYRTIEKEARPGPMPGIRPPMGAGAHIGPPQSTKGGSGAMGVIMPLYTVAIVIFFLYTIMKVLFKKSEEEEPSLPKMKDFHLDPEYRKYVFAEEYLDNSNTSHRDILKRQEREASKLRKRNDSAASRETKIEDEQMDQLRRRLEDTEKAMERLMSQMGSVTDKLTAAKITEVLSHAQTQAKLMKDTGEIGSEDDLTTSEAFTNTISDDFSLPLVLKKHLLGLEAKGLCLKGTHGSFVEPSPQLPTETSLNNKITCIDNQPDGLSPLSGSLPSTSNAEVTDTPVIYIDEMHASVNKLDEFDIAEEKSPNIGNQSFSPSYQDKSLPLKNNEDDPDLDEIVLLSDLAMLDDVEENFEKSDSDGSETGADVSEMKSFAEEEIFLETPTDFQKTSAYVIPEVIYDEDIKIANQHELVEHSTQTDVEQKFSILNMENTYQVKEKDATNETKFARALNEIILDATLPVESQLLVRDSRTSSSLSDHIDIDASDSENEACIITSQVSLTFIGMGQSKDNLVSISDAQRYQISGHKQSEANIHFPKETHAGSQQLQQSLIEKSSDSSTIHENEKEYHPEEICLNCEIRVPQNNNGEVEQTANISEDNFKFGDAAQAANYIKINYNEFGKTMSMDSVDLTSELLTGLSSTNACNEYLIERPRSPVPPLHIDLPKIVDKNAYHEKHSSQSNSNLNIDRLINIFAIDLIQKLTEDAMNEFFKTSVENSSNKRQLSQKIPESSNLLLASTKDAELMTNTSRVIYKMQLGDIDINDKSESMKNETLNYSLTNPSTDCCALTTNYNNDLHLNKNKIIDNISQPSFPSTSHGSGSSVSNLGDLDEVKPEQTSENLS